MTSENKPTIAPTADDRAMAENHLLFLEIMLDRGNREGALAMLAELAQAKRLLALTSEPFEKKIE